MADYRVKAFWDKEAEVFVATSDDVPGLIVEAEEMPELLENITLVARALLSRMNAEGGRLLVDTATIAENFETYTLAA